MRHLLIFFFLIPVVQETPELPWELDRPLVCYYIGIVRPYTDRYGNDLGIEEIEFYRYNATRHSGSPENVYYNLPHPATGEYDNHDWTRIKAGWAKDDNTHILGEFDDEYWDAVLLWAEELNNRGIAFIYSVFDACGLKYPEVNHWGFSHHNNLGINAGHVNRFLKYQGVAWEYQKMLMLQTLETIGHLPNVIIELCNEPYGDTATMQKWHAEMMAYLVEMKMELGYGHVQIQLNAHSTELNFLTPEFISVHWHNTGLWLSDVVERDINPDGYMQRPGRQVRSTDTGTFRFDYNWGEFLRYNLDLGISSEILIIDFPDHGHWQIKNEMERRYEF